MAYKYIMCKSIVLELSSKVYTSNIEKIRSKPINYKAVKISVQNYRCYTANPIQILLKAMVVVP